MDVGDLRTAFSRIADTMARHRQELIDLDARTGDGDLGISVSAGFAAVHNYLVSADETDLGRALAKCSSAFNEAAPSTLGTIISVGLMGMAKALRGRTEASFAELVAAFEAGLALIMERAQSKPGERTILDSIHPAVQALKQHAEAGCGAALRAAFTAAEQGMKATATMKPVHGRAAYYGEKAMGEIDGGAAVGKLIFESLV